MAIVVGTVGDVILNWLIEYTCILFTCKCTVVRPRTESPTESGHLTNFVWIKNSCGRFLLPLFLLACCKVNL